MSRLIYNIWLAFIAFLLFGCVDESELIKPKEPKSFTDKADSFGYLNLIRKSLNLQELKLDDRLKISSSAHATYCAKNSLTGHDELPNKPYFYAKTPSERAQKAGLKTAVVSENITYKKYPELYIDSLMSAIYHRFGFTDTDIDMLGFASIKGENINASVFNMSNSKLNKLCSQKSGVKSGSYVIGACSDKNQRIAKDKFNSTKASAQKLVLYPSTLPAQAYFSGETPDPMPSCKILSTPVSAEFSKSLPAPKLINFEIYKDGKKLENTHLLDAKNDPNKRFSPHQFALFSLTPFEFDATYQAVIKYKLGKNIEQKSWEFRTQTPQREYFVINGGERLAIKADTEYDLFFMPKDCNDLLKEYSYKSGVKSANIAQIDSNLLRVKLGGLKSQRLTLSAGDKSVELVLVSSSEGSFKPNGIIAAALILAAILMIYLAIRKRR